MQQALASIYTPSPWQQEFHLLPHNEALGAGSAGPGKTETLLHEADGQIFIEHQRCEQRDHRHHHPWGSSSGWALYLRRTTPMLLQTQVRFQRIIKVIDPKARWHASDNMWELSSGYRYQFGHCNEVADFERYMSNEYTLILFDELVQFLKEQYDQIITRLRSTDPMLSKMLKVRSMSNPVMRRGQNENFTITDPYWVRKMFVEPHQEGRKTLKRKLVRKDGRVAWHTLIYLPAKLHDNPNKEFVDDYELKLLNAPPHIRLALLEGHWFITADSFFGALWSEQIHTCAPFKIPPDWPVFRSMDWGYKTHGACHWWAFDGEGTWYVFKELSFINKTADEVAEAVKEIEKSLELWGHKGSRITGPADTQLWEKRGEKGKSKAEEFMAKGIQWIPADKKSRARNAERVAALLGAHQHGTRSPGLVFFKNCGNAIRTVPAIQMDPNDPNEPLKGGEDHWYDSVSYGAAHASRGGSFVGPRKDDDDDEFDQELDARESRGRYGYGSAVC